MPARRTSDDKEHVLEDEARLLYVAMTRATQELVMTQHEESVMTQHEESVLWDKVRKAMGVLDKV
jgi:superfamily I DNA/RNA helicase